MSDSIQPIKNQDNYLVIEAVNTSIVCGRNGLDIAQINPQVFTVRRKNSGAGIDVYNANVVVTGCLWGQGYISGTLITQENFADLAAQVKADASGGGSGDDVNIVDGFGSNSPTDASSINNATVLKSALDALDGSAIKYNSDGNIEIHTGTKILGTENTGVEDVMLWLASYIVDQVTYQQLEVGSSHIHLNLNTNTDMYYGIRVTVDTPEGKKQIAYMDDLPTLGNFVDLSSDQTIGGNKTFTGNINSAGSVLFPSKGNIGSNNFRAGTLFADDVITTNRPKVGSASSSENVALVSDFSDRVTLDTDQDITGKKNFTNIPTINGVNIATQDQNAYYSGDLSSTGSNLTFTFGTVTAKVSRIDSTTINVELSSSSNVDVNITSKHTGLSSVNGNRESISLTSTPVQIDSITIGTYILAEYWVKKNDSLYYITAGSNPDQSDSWVLITTYHNQD